MGDMFFGKSLPLGNAAALRFRMATLTTGAWLGIAMVAAGLAYFGLTWNAGNRPLLTGIGIAVGVSDVGVLLLPMERIVAGRWREDFFLGWTLSTVAVVLLLGALDPTVPSPLTLPLMMPMLFAGMSYPPASARICCATVVFGYGAEVLILGQISAFSLFLFMVILWTAGMCLWQARNREQQHLELEHQRDELARIADIDPLTEALNRRGFEELLGRELAEAARGERPLTLAVLDLDDFKAVNDREGHGAGDAVLCETVKRMSRVLRPMDAVGRLGGDEFAVLFPRTGEAEAEMAVRRLRGALGDLVSTSIGYSCFPSDGASPEELSKRADLRLYSAKAKRQRGSKEEALELSWATALADSIDRRMNGTHQHSRQVAEYSVGIARGLGWDESQLAQLRLAATLHDVGKASVPDRILSKPGRLEPAEYEEIQRHTVIGAEMLARIDGLDEIVPWVRHSHEHFDGSGYPDGLVGEAIPAASRILLTADAFDAMTSDRPYRQALPVDEALAELQRHAGTQFDAGCVAELAAVLSAPNRTAASSTHRLPLEAMNQRMLQRRSLSPRSRPRASAS
jgi:diguanylate cyclase (GGDEF)-like protein/putative nucleotidyltransferase with HDIG domain